MADCGKHQAVWRTVEGCAHCKLERAVAALRYHAEVRMGEACFGANRRTALHMDAEPQCMCRWCITQRVLDENR